MCGIIGYIGYRDAINILVDGLKRLEYRGYDSAGIGVLDSKLQVFKKVGEISTLTKKIPKFKGKTGIGHTRWATHGGVSQENAHPQVSKDNKIAVVHNGIIENFMQLRDMLKKKGYNFSSQTDTEVIAHLIYDNYHKDIKTAVAQALKHIKGSYALVVMCDDEPDVLVGARKESPLVVGIGDNENLIASDIPALLQYTNRVIYLDDDDLCVVTRNSVFFYDKMNKPLEKEEQLITWDVKDAEKSGFPHFMLKEIFEQPDSIHQTIRGRVSEINRTIEFPDRVENLLKESFRSIQIIACGTSYYAGLIGKYLIEEHTPIPVLVDLASEYRMLQFQSSATLVVAITQSGETADTLAALRRAKQSGCKTLVITNVIGSTATRLADAYILMQSGPEIGVAATKTFTAQLIILYLLSLKLGILNNYIGPDEIYHELVHIKVLPRRIRQVLERAEMIKKYAQKFRNVQSVFFIGRGLNFPLSLEGALKLKEISYIHAEGFASGELKHGPFALLTKNTPVVAIVQNDGFYEKMIGNIGEVKARGPEVLAIVADSDREVEKHADVVLRFPENGDILSCIPIAVLLQLLAYYVADLRGCPIDKPRNLAKSVTVQ